VPTACKQADERRINDFGLEEERRDVAVEVVDRHERQPVRPGKRFGSREPDEKGADQARASGDCDRANAVEGHPRLVQGLLDDRGDELEVAPRRNLGDDPAVAGVKLGLGRYDARAHHPLARHERGRGLVARGLEAQDHVVPVPTEDTGTGSRHMIRASSRLSV
jgi:hypothetical protein